MLKKLLAILDSDGPRLYTLLVRLTLRDDVAEDLLQDLFVKASQSESITGISDLHAYIRRMAINLAFDWRRKQHVQDRYAESLQIENNCEVPVWLKLSQHEQAERILMLAAQLPELQRQAFALRYVHDESFGQIGRAMGRTAHQARGLCHAAVQEIRRQLEVSGSVELKSQ